MPLPWLRAHYVFVYAILGALLPYLSIYAAARGLSDTQIGYVLGVFGLAVIVAPPVYTALADLWRNNRRIITFCYGLGALTLLALAAAHSFPAILLAHLAFALAFTSLIPLLDGLTFATIAQPAERPERLPQNNNANEANNADANGGSRRPPADDAPPRAAYRSIRVWGSFGFMVPGVGFAAAFAWLDLPDLTVASAAVLTAAAFAFVGLIAAQRLPAYRADQALARRLPTLDALRAFARPPLRSFLSALFLLFASISMYYTFYPPYLESLGVRPAYLGLITNLGVGIEVAFMLAAGALLRRLGFRGVMILGIASQLVRMTLLAAFPHPVVGVATQVFHGPTVLALYLLPPMYLNHKADPRCRNSMLGLYAMTCLGFARVLGAGAGGYISDAVGGELPGRRLAFAVAAALALFATTLFAVAFRDRPQLPEQRL